MVAGEGNPAGDVPVRGDVPARDLSAVDCLRNTTFGLSENKYIYS